MKKKKEEMRNIENSFQEPVYSPVTGMICDKPIKTYYASEIIAYYIKTLKFDVSYLFKGKDKLGLYICPETGYTFFFPGIEGDDEFYSIKKPNSESYMDWKWEHEEALSFIEDGNRVLEVGSGAGGFLQGLSNRRHIVASGLEINPSAIAVAKIRGVMIVNESFYFHANCSDGIYDVVCAFQVLEHIQNVSNFMNSAKKCLKPGGHLIISVPDNESFVGALDPFSDRPPYHVGRYTTSSLEKIGSYFGFKKCYLNKEPLQEYHFTAVEKVVKRKLFGENHYFQKFCTSIGGNWLIRNMVSTCSVWMNGHTIIMVFIK